MFCDRRLSAIDHRLSVILGHVLACWQTKKKCGVRRTYSDLIKGGGSGDSSFKSFSLVDVLSITRQVAFFLLSGLPFL